MKTHTHFKKILLLISFIFTFHFSLVSYINSSFLEQFASVKYLGLLYVISAIISILFLSQVEKLLIRYGNFRITLFLIFIDIIALSGLVLSKFSGFYISPLLPYIFFVLHYATGVLLLKFTLDIFFEEYSEDKNTGIIRGGLLTAANLAWFISPFIFSRILTDSDFWKIYLISLIFTIILLALIVLTFRNAKEPSYRRVYIRQAIKDMVKRKDLLRISTANFLMHFFFSWMVIYMPIHLHENMGISWVEIGIIFTAMLVPYVILDMPLGYISDKLLGEKEILIFGFLLVFLSTLPIAFIDSTSIYLWMGILICTRIGSTILEMMTNTYFFKKVNAEDGHLISLFRNSQPISYIIGPALGSLLLALGLYSGNLFVILAFIMLSGLYFVIPIKDTM